MATLKRAMPALICLLVLTGTVVGGLVQRQFDAGSEGTELLKQAGEALKRPLPGRIGNWEMLADSPLNAEVVKMLRCQGYINRVYVHRETGDRVTVAVLVGPAGPIAVHTPEICYSSRDFRVTGQRTIAKIADKQAGEHTFWDVSFVSNDVVSSKLRALYAWSTGDHWEAIKEPRFSHGGKSLLYKIQIAGEPQSESSGFDPCQDFLSAFIAQLQPRLISAEST